MSEAQKRTNEIPEFLKAPKAMLDARRADVEKMVVSLRAAANARVKDVDQIISKVSKQHWDLEKLEKSVKDLQAEGRGRIEKAVERAGSLREEMVKRVEALKEKAIDGLGLATKADLKALRKDLKKMIADEKSNGAH